MNHTAAAPRIVEYPSSDGQPMAETPVHRDAMIDAIRVLARHFARRPDVYVSGNMLMYYEEGNPRKSLAPVDGARALHNETLGLSLRLRGQTLRMHDPATGKDLLTPEEAEEAEAAVRRAIEAEISRLRARIHELERSARASEPPRF